MGSEKIITNAENKLNTLFFSAKLLEGNICMNEYLTVIVKAFFVSINVLTEE